ncbi:DEAD-box ATP-dependent RNA helicase CshA [Streptomyces fumanus]
MTLPVALTGTDVIGQAKTGTGKTLGFGLPLLERVTVPADVEAGRAAPEALTDAPQALVVVPTRELCQQVTNDLLTAGKVRNVRVVAIYGGRAYEPQVEALKQGVDVVVGTPGRLLDLAGQKKLNLKHIKSLVLDEADENARPGLPARRREDHQHAAGQAPDHAVLGHHAGRGDRSRPPLHVAAHPHPGHLAGRRGHHGGEHQAVRLPRAQHGQARDGRAHTAGRGPGPGHGLLPRSAPRPTSPTSSSRTDPEREPLSLRRRPGPALHAGPGRRRCRSRAPAPAPARRPAPDRLFP